MRPITLCAQIMILSGIVAGLGAQAPAAMTAFSYQGRLSDSGGPANGRYDLRFVLYNAEAGGAPAGNPVTHLNITATGGLFTTFVDFGASVFDGSNYWLEVSVRPAGSNAFTTLSPRQAVTPAPYAIRSYTAGVADIATNALQLGGLAATEFVRANDSRLTNGIPVAAGSPAYIQNSNGTAATQEDSAFSISGNGTLGGQLFASKGVLGLSPAGNALAGIGGDAGVFGLGGNYGVSGQQNALFGPGAGVYGTTDSGGAYGVYGLVSGGTTNAGVYGKATGTDGIGMRGQADRGANSKGVVGQSGAGTGVYGSTASGLAGNAGVKGVASDPNGNGVMGEADGTTGYGVYGRSASGTGVRGSSDTGRGVDGLSSSGGVGVYGNNLGSNTKGYAGDFFGRVRVAGDLILDRQGAIRMPGAGVGASTAAFIHIAGAGNIGGIGKVTTILDHPLANGDPNAILLITQTQDIADSGYTKTPYLLFYGASRWVIQTSDLSEMKAGTKFNILIIKNQ